ncbi:MAG: hypothetical protein A2998_00355 [Candidatus Staskawiczbacteria bacterium RIFCSPLOWO2_01_FULL_37_25b]|uniref:Uncharacterized protein n=2 Tax=Candidatus Staskawicziibacteriota TaxID=1817916 RepID=A0A1G2HP60_9BACT|nr:MAG: hypothetical protein A2812_03485 [Candidatus Staskawiczbacteria bacterium RIFCSPHIGHO2_01_FULL_36_16]OGZ71674.1 MAG: hypothetical protein A2998_00355 [Candidatus Staskawiczbacteria bacterium RIFCSPLOWO2_01_FULL_37_25b]
MILPRIVLAVGEKRDMKMEEYEKLPKHNPEQTCKKCGKSYPIWQLHLFLGEKRKRLAHNFCPSSEAIKGRIVEICMKCKMEEVVKKWYE